MVVAKVIWKFLLTFYLSSLLQVDKVDSERLWVINAEERSQYLVHLATASLKRACWLQAVVV